MSATETLTVGFGDGDAGVQGLAIEGSGALLSIDGHLAPAPGFDLTDVDGAACRVRGDGDYDVTLEPVSPPVELGPATRTWICRARGNTGGRLLDGFGSLTRSAAPADGVTLQRAVIAWLGPELALALAARRPRKAGGHGDEELHAAILRGASLEPVPVEDPRLSSTYDGDGRLIRCGIELWEPADAEFAQRLGGIATAHGDLVHPNGARSRVAFIAWHGERQQGIGSYVITKSPRRP